LDDKPALTGLLAGVHVERKEKERNMDTEDFTELAEAILEDHARELFDEDLEVLE
jgi:hypothetical protein